MLQINKKSAATTAMLLGALAAAPLAYGQADITWTAGNGDFATDGNWDSGFVPEAIFGETAFISNGSTVTLSTDRSANPAGTIFLGGSVGTSGSLDILNGGVLVVENEPVAEATQGIVFVGGVGNFGSLTVRNGGSASARSFNVANRFLNPVLGISQQNFILVESGGTLATTQNTDLSFPVRGNLSIGAILDLQGSSATVNVASNLESAGTSVYRFDGFGGGPSVINVAGNAEYDGTVELDLTGAPALADGQAYTIIDSATTSGSFDAVNVIGQAVTPGMNISVQSVAGGTNGLLSQVTIDNRLVATVNRDTGEVSISNPFGGNEALIGYSVLSDAGTLNAAAWDSLDDQSTAGWVEGSGSATSLNELRGLGSTTISSGGFEPSLGNVYAPTKSATFGEATAEDIVVEYALAGSTEIFEAQVIYTGSATINNLVLVVDPDTGEAVLENNSLSSVDLTGYTISSEAGSLDVVGWDSLSDQSISSWAEADPDSNALSELIASGSDAFSLAAGGSVDLGALFSTGSDQDLVLEFLLAGDTALAEGVVVYGAISAPLVPGDADGDGDVDDTDLGIAISNFTGPVGAAGNKTLAQGDTDGDGDVDDTDLGVMISGFTGPLAPAAAAVPEPTSLALLGLGGLLIARRRRA